MAMILVFVRTVTEVLSTLKTERYHYYLQAILFSVIRCYTGFYWYHYEFIGMICLYKAHRFGEERYTRELSSHKGETNKYSSEKMSTL